MENLESGGVEASTDPRADQSLVCPFRECGRKFVSDIELNNHMQRRHKPAPVVEEITQTSQISTAAETEASALKETPIPIKAKANFATGKLEMVENNMKPVAK